MKKIIALLLLVCLPVIGRAENPYEEIGKKVAETIDTENRQGYIVIYKEDYDNLLHLKTQLMSKLNAFSNANMNRYINHFLPVCQDLCSQILTMEYRSYELGNIKLIETENRDQLSYLRDKIAVLEMRDIYLQSQINEFMRIK